MMLWYSMLWYGALTSAHLGPPPQVYDTYAAGAEAGGMYAAESDEATGSGGPFERLG